jgi:alanine racemase
LPQRALASVNLAAIERNVTRLRGALTGGAALCAVVKANGYGHGMVPAARAALAGGASMLAVATALEAADLRAGEIDAPILVLGAISHQELPIALRAGAEIVVWNERFVEALLASRAAARDSRTPTGVHVKLDSGLGRLGTRDRSEALAVAERVSGARGALTLTGAMTHFATADEEPDFMRVQLERFELFLGDLRARHPRLIVHAANSAATLREPASHFDLVRCGIAIYGGDPMNQDPDHHALEPALELSSYVAAVKLARAGDSTGYGRRFIAERDTWIATLPIGYGDGIRRALTNNCDVLIGGRRYPLVGTVSMDNVTVNLGAAPAASVGEQAIIIGRHGGARQTAEDLAARIATINYEILCGVSSRVPRSYHHDGQPAS